MNDSEFANAVVSAYRNMDKFNKRILEGLFKNWMGKDNFEKVIGRMNEKEGEQ